MSSRVSGHPLYEKSCQSKKRKTMKMIFLLCQFEKAGMVVGHLPHEFEVSRLLTFFIRHGGTIICEVTGHKRLGKTAWIDHATIWEGPASLCHTANLARSFTLSKVCDMKTM